MILLQEITMCKISSPFCDVVDEIDVVDLLEILDDLRLSVMLGAIAGLAKHTR